MHEVVPARPSWRRQVEQGTAIAIGIGAAVSAGAVPPDSPAGAVADTLLGAAVEGQRRALDVAESALAAGGAVARAGMRFAPIRSFAARASRSAVPVRAHGRAVREVAGAVTRDAIPRYVTQVTRTALDAVPLDEIIGGLDVQSIIDRVDIEELLGRVDVAALVDRVDVGRIIDRVDIQTLLDRIDVEALVGRVDMEALIDRIDVDALVERTDLGRIVAQSTGGVASGAVDLVRRQGVGLDSFVARWATRLRPGALADAPPGPPLLVDEEP